MKKILHLLALFCLLAVGTGAVNAETYTLELTKESLDLNGTSYAANNISHSVNATGKNGSTRSIEIYTNQQMVQSQAWQWQASKGYLYNTTDLGEIKSVIISSSAGSYTVYGGKSENPSTVVNSPNSFPSGNGYFKVAVGSVLGKVNSITITFEIGDSTEQPGQGGEGGGNETPDPTPGESQEVTFDFSNPSEFAQGTFEANKGTIINDFSSGNVNFHIDQASGANEDQKLRFYNLTDLRCSSAGGQKGHKFTISTIDGSNIIKIEFTGSKNAMTASPEKLDGYNWTGKASSVTFTTTDQVIFTKIKVIYEVPQTGPVEFTFDTNIPTEMQVGDTYTLVLPEPLPNNFEIISEDDDIATVSDDAPYVITAVSPSTANFTATWEADENYTEGEKDFSIEIVAKKSDVTTFAYSAETANFDLAENAANDPLPVLNMDPQGLTVTYTSSDVKVASVSENGKVTPLAVGETIITATFAGNEQYNGTSASYTLTVINSDIKESTVIFYPDQEDDNDVADLKVSMAGQSEIAGTEQTATKIEGGNVYFWIEKKNTGSVSQVNGTEVRWYKDDILHIVPINNATITKVVMSQTSGNANTNSIDNEYGKGSTNGLIYTWIGRIDEDLQLSNSAQTRFTKLTVVYEGGDEVEIPTMKIGDFNVKTSSGQTINEGGEVTMKYPDDLTFKALNAEKYVIEYTDKNNKEELANINTSVEDNYEASYQPHREFENADITITASAQGLEPKTFSFKLTYIIPEVTPYELVTSEADLIENAHYVIAANVGNDVLAMSNATFSGAIKGKKASIDESILSVTDEVLVLKLGRSEDADYPWVLNFVNYLGNGTGLNGKSSGTDFATTKGAAKIEFNQETKECSIVFKISDTRKIFYRTNGYDFFRNYTIEDTEVGNEFFNVSLYKRIADAPEKPVSGGNLKDNNPYITLTANEDHDVYYDVYILDKDYLGYGQESTPRRAAERQDGSTQHEGYFLAAKGTHNAEVSNSNGNNTYKLYVSPMLEDANGNDNNYSTLQALDAANKVLMVSTYAYHAPSAQKSDVIAYALDPTTGTPTGLDSIISDVDSEAQYFNLQGLKVDRPEKGGLYIKVKGGKSSKVVF